MHGEGEANVMNEMGLKERCDEVTMFNDAGDARESWNLP